MPAANFGNTGMARHQFDDVWSRLRFGEQPESRPDNTSSEQCRWKSVDDFVDHFDQHRANFFSPSDLVCADEHVSVWCGLGGFWTNTGVPVHVAMERKPDSGCEIQNSACGRSGTMMRLKLVKTAEEQHAGTKDDDMEPPHRTAIVKHPVEPWADSTAGRIVCADLHFASVPTVIEMH